MKKSNYYLLTFLSMMLFLPMLLLACSDDEDRFNDTNVYLSCPNDKHPHMIDLGLPSGTKWACCNVGSKKPDSFGYYIQWGETYGYSGSSVCDWSTYDHFIGGPYMVEDIGSNISGTEYDVAHVSWGKLWRMPTVNEAQELVDNCSHEWTTLGNVSGLKLSGKNGGSIFLPAAGIRQGTLLFNDGVMGYYWTSEPGGASRESSRILCFTSNYIGPVGDFHNSANRCYGLSVRPIAAN